MARGKYDIFIAKQAIYGFNTNPDKLDKYVNEIFSAKTQK
jgi:hypothetical protein